MQVASVITNRGTLRDEIEGWTYEDSDLLVRRYHRLNPHKIMIGYTPSSNIPYYGTIMEMLADGWKLLGPPEKEVYPVEEGSEIEKSGATRIVQYGWWLTREKK